MKGFVFTSFLEMIEQRFSLDMVDSIILKSRLPSGAAYTALGTYDHQEMLELVTQLHAETGIPVRDLVLLFGEYLFDRLVEGYPQFVDRSMSLFGFLQNVHTYIHVEVKKLYPEAELPAFDYDSSQPGRLIMTYRSSRPFADLAEGLLSRAIQHFGEPIALTRRDLPATGQQYAAEFSLVRTEVPA